MYLIANTWIRYRDRVDQMNTTVNIVLQKCVPANLFQ
jgi:hypothetical protein